MSTQVKRNQIDTNLIDGWTPVSSTWTYASASTITVPSGAASIYQKGDRIKWTQTTVKYGVIVAVADTLLTIAVNTDYTVANAAISSIYYSHQANPLGYPHWFNYTPSITYAGGTTDPTSNTIGFAKYNVTANICSIVLKSTLVKGTGDRTVIMFSDPVTRLSTGIMSLNAYSACSGANAMPVCVHEATAKQEIFETMAGNGDYAINASYDI